MLLSAAAEKKEQFIRQKQFTGNASPLTLAWGRRVSDPTPSLLWLQESMLCGSLLLEIQWILGSSGCCPPMMGLLLCWRAACMLQQCHRSCGSGVRGKHSTDHTPLQHSCQAIGSQAAEDFSQVLPQPKPAQPCPTPPFLPGPPAQQPSLPRSRCGWKLFPTALPCITPTRALPEDLTFVKKHNMRG